ncbi:hypothetical protein [Streptomyces sp. NPDC005486]|uniref:hypothetical protein n=1 Tax=Streptomyces sp. NPDC005486 TaxID=3155345 RepID=UPI0033B58561
MGICSVAVLCGQEGRFVRGGAYPSLDGVDDELLVQVSGADRVVYAGLAIVIGVLFPLVAAIYRVRYVELLRSIAGLAWIAFVTRIADHVGLPIVHMIGEVAHQRALRHQPVCPDGRRLGDRSRPAAGTVQPPAGVSSLLYGHQVSQE